MIKHIVYYLFTGFLGLSMIACTGNDIIYPDLEKDNIVHYASWESICQSGITTDYHESILKIQSSSVVRWSLLFIGENGSDNTWCKPSVTEGNAYSDFAINFSENTTASDRVGKLRCILSRRNDANGNAMYDENGKLLQDTLYIPVSQKMGPTRINSDVQNLQYGPMHSNGIVSLTSNTEWSIEIKYEEENVENWLSLNRMQGAGNMTLIASLLPNVTGRERKASLVITMMHPNDIDSPKDEKKPLVIEFVQKDKLEEPQLQLKSDYELMLKWNEVVGATHYYLTAYDATDQVVADTTVMGKTQILLSEYSYRNHYVGALTWKVKAFADVDNLHFESSQAAVSLHSHFASNSGDGSIEHPFVIDAPYQLGNVAQFLHSNFRQDADLDMLEVKNFEPLAQDRDQLGYIGDFTGEYNGNNHKIVNLLINAPDYYYVGLFAQLGQTAYIHHLTFEKCAVFGKINVGMIAGIGRGNLSNIIIDEQTTIKGNGINDYKVGGLIGSYLGEGAIVNSTNKATVGEEKKGNMIGGMVGYCDGMLCFEDCVNDGAIKGNTNAAGFVAFLYKNLTKNNRISFDHCINNGNIGPLIGGNRIGGGFIAQGNADIDINRCVNKGSISGGGSFAGFLGRVNPLETNTVSVRNSYNTGAISNDAKNANGNNSANGIIGKREDATSAVVKIENCYNVGKMTSSCGFADGMVGFCTKTFVAASNVVCLDDASCKTQGTYLIAGNSSSHAFIFKNATLEEMKNEATFTGWDFNTIWQREIPYPELK